VGWGNGVLEHKSGNISETRKDRGKVTVDTMTAGASTPLKHGRSLRP